MGLVALVDALHAGDVGEAAGAVLIDLLLTEAGDRPESPVGSE